MIDESDDESEDATIRNIPNLSPESKIASAPDDSKADSGYT